MGEHEPMEVWPLASYLAEEMTERRWTSVDVAVRMGGSEPAKDVLVVELLLSVQRDTLIFDDDLLKRLGTAFGVSYEVFRNLDDVWRQNPTKRVPFEPDESLFGSQRRSP